MRHIIPISGKDSLATAIVQREREPDLPYEYVFCDVGMELPETMRWMDDVETYLGVTITRPGVSLLSLIEGNNLLPSMHMRFCTDGGKLAPLRKYLGDDDAVQYIGIRADEEHRANQRLSPTTTNKFPLIEEGIDLAGVYALLNERGLTPPSFFWQRLYDEVLDRCSLTYKTYVSRLPPWHLSSLFSWRSRSNCYMCFYQRMYEWVGLLEHHPDLFESAERLEKKYGQAGRIATRLVMVKDFTLRADGPLANIRLLADQIFWKRVAKVHKLVVEMRHEPDGNLLGTVSCGAYCGK